MTEIQRKIEIQASMQAVYRQWLRFEDFPMFMEGIKEVYRIDAHTYHWRAEILGQEEEWDAQVTEAIPYSRIKWSSIRGIPNRGSVLIKALSDSRSLLSLSLYYEPQNALQGIGQFFGLMSGRIQEDLGRFRNLVEGNPHAAYYGACSTQHH